MLIDFIKEKLERRKRITPLQKELLDIVDFYSCVKSLVPFKDTYLQCKYLENHSTKVLQIKFRDKWYSFKARNPININGHSDYYQPEVDFDRSQVTFSTEIGKLDFYVNENFKLEIGNTLNLNVTEIKELIKYTKQVLSEKVNKERNIFKSEKESKMELGRQLESLYETEETE